MTDGIKAMERARVTGPPPLRWAAWLLSLTAHATAAALLVQASLMVRQEREQRPEGIEFILELSRALPRQDLATQPQAETTPVSAPVVEPAPEQRVIASDPVKKSRPAPLSADQRPAETAAPLERPEPGNKPSQEDLISSGALPPRPASRATARQVPSKRAERVLPLPEPKSDANNESNPLQASPQPAGSRPSAAIAAPLAEPSIIDPGWRRALSTWMQSHRHYPEAARQRGEEGTVGVAFTVSQDGTVTAVRVVSPSGSALLDQSVRDMLEGQKVPAFIAGVGQQQIQIMVNIRFSLDRRP